MKNPKIGIERKERCMAFCVRLKNIMPPKRALGGVLSLRLSVVFGLGESDSGVFFFFINVMNFA